MTAEEREKEKAREIVYSWRGYSGSIKLEKELIELISSAIREARREQAKIDAGIAEDHDCCNTAKAIREAAIRKASEEG